jgi:CDP-glycerol glycerophosphotransferase (TagB/SpsB family)
VASFSFRAGNAAKLLRIPLYVLGRVATWVIPRTRDLWVFGSAAGLADGAWALWQHATAHGERAIWLVSDAAQRDAAASQGVHAITRSSLSGFWYTARARVVVVTHGFGDVNRYATTGAFIVQLWHGIPLKRIGLDSPATVQAPSRFLRTIVRGFYRATQRRIGLIPAASHPVRGRLESAFALPDERVPVTGEPRVDVLSAGDDHSRRETARARIDALVGDTGDRPLVLYAPTWRDGAPDPAVPDPAAWQLIDGALEAADAVLLIRSHPLGAGDYGGGGGRVRMLGSDLVSDVTPLLPGVDVLVTDYSSLLFDVTLVPVPTVYFAPDASSYAVERGFYGRYDDLTLGAHARSWTEAMAQVLAVLLDEGERARRLDRARQIDRAVHAHRDGRNTERVYRAITEKVRRR